MEPKMFRIVQWDGSEEIVAVKFDGDNALILYLEDEEECHEVSELYFWHHLQPKEVVKQ